MINTEWMRPLALALLVAGLGLATAACQPSPALDPADGAGQTESPQGDEAGGDDESGEEADEVAEAGDPEAGKKEFATCAGCHGPDGKGLPNLGKDLHNNAFLAEMTDAEAVAFLKVGREATHPLNTTGVAMPPKGGNPALDDQDLANIVAYVRTLK